MLALIRAPHEAPLIEEIDVLDQAILLANGCDVEVIAPSLVLS